MIKIILISTIYLFVVSSLIIPNVLAQPRSYNYYFEKFDNNYDDYCKNILYYFRYDERYKKTNKTSDEKKKNKYGALKEKNENDCKILWEKFENAIDREFGLNPYAINFKLLYEDYKDAYYNYKMYSGKYSGSKEKSYATKFKKYKEESEQLKNDYRVAFKEMRLNPEQTYEYYMKKFEDAHNEYCEASFYYFKFKVRYTASNRASDKKKKTKFKNLRHEKEHEYKRFWKKFEDAVEEEFGESSFVCNFKNLYEKHRLAYYRYKKNEGRYVGSSSGSRKDVYKTDYEGSLDDFKQLEYEYKIAEKDMISDHATYFIKKIIDGNYDIGAKLSEIYTAYFTGDSNLPFESIESQKVKIKDTNYVVHIRYDIIDINCGIETNNTPCKELSCYYSSPVHLNIQIEDTSKNADNEENIIVDLHALIKDIEIKNNNLCFSLLTWENKLKSFRDECFKKEFCREFPDIKKDIMGPFILGISIVTGSSVANIIGRFISSLDWRFVLTAPSTSYSVSVLEKEYLWAASIALICLKDLGILEMNSDFPIKILKRGDFAL